MTTYKPKLIEVALPLALINSAAAKEKMMGAAPHPQNLHRWWARRPLAAARAVVWASLVDDPSADAALTDEEQESERQRLFEILGRLVQWENSNNEVVLAEAKAEIARCYPEGAPPLLDPFGGGGAIPLEAHRLGLSALSGDLNPVAVLIQRSMIEVAPRFAGQAAVNPESANPLSTWERNQGLAADISAYGDLLRKRVEERVGSCYPSINAADGESLTPLVWIWARTVQSPDPSWRGQVPLVASWTLSKKSGRPTIWIEPKVDRSSQAITYEVRHGGVPTVERTVNRGNGVCIATGSAMPYEYIRDESFAGRMGQQLMAVVAEGPSGRTYCSPDSSSENAPLVVPEPAWKPTAKVGIHPRNISTPPFGLDEWWKHFTARQLLTLSVFCEELEGIRADVMRDATRSGMDSSDLPLRDGGTGALAYAEAIMTFLAFNIDKCAEHWSSVCSWHTSNEQIRNVFSRQAIPMTWDFAEVNPFSGRMGSWESQLRGLVGAVRDCLSPPGSVAGEVVQMDATARVNAAKGCFNQRNEPIGSPRATPSASPNVTRLSSRSPRASPPRRSLSSSPVPSASTASPRPRRCSCDSIAATSVATPVLATPGTGVPTR